jgi:hypothetical protein
MGQTSCFFACACSEKSIAKVPVRIMTTGALFREINQRPASGKGGMSPVRSSVRVRQKLKGRVSYLAHEPGRFLATDPSLPWIKGAARCWYSPAGGRIPNSGKTASALLTYYEVVS